MKLTRLEIIQAVPYIPDALERTELESCTEAYMDLRLSGETKTSEKIMNTIRTKVMMAIPSILKL